MQLTRDKYQESSFFLEQMRESLDDDSFRYYLSAFVSSARSITFILQKEYKHSQYGGTFRRWYSGAENGQTPSNQGAVQDRMRDDPLFEFMKALRNTVLKEGLPLTTETMLTDTDISPTTLELLVDSGLPKPQVIVEATDGTIIGSTLGFAWRLEEREGMTELLSLGEDGTWSVVMGLSDLEYDMSELRCRYRFDYQLEDGADLNEVFFFGEDDVPESIQNRSRTPKDVNAVIAGLCGQYLQKIDSILTEWEYFVNGDMSSSELING